MCRQLRITTKVILQPRLGLSFEGVKLGHWHLEHIVSAFLGMGHRRHRQLSSVKTLSAFFI
jgi:hypothetical protein